MEGENDPKPDRKLDFASLPGLLIVYREEQLSIQRRLSEALDRIQKLEQQLTEILARLTPGG
jgi:hypothetical protein